MFRKINIYLYKNTPTMYNIFAEFRIWYFCNIGKPGKARQVVNEYFGF